MRQDERDTENTEAMGEELAKDKDRKMDDRKIKAKEGKI